MFAIVSPMPLPSPYYFVVPALAVVEQIFSPESAVAPAAPSVGLTISACADDSFFNSKFVRCQRSGAMAEVRFALDSDQHGVITGKPYTQEVFDCFAMQRSALQAASRAGVAPEGKNRVKIELVQVRSTSFLRTTGRKHKQEAYSISLLHGKDSRVKYQKGDFDILAAYIAPEKTWYIIPFDEIAGLSGIQIYPGHKPNSRYYQFREAWHLIGK